MYDMHTHTIFSDGDLIPSELLRRAEVMGLKAIAFTDHADASNIEFIIPQIVKVCNELNRIKKIKCLPGIELTHCPPSSIQALVKKARELGAKVVIVHGETIVEPVEKGTNMSAIKAGVDILAHPGLITEDEVKEAVKNNVFLEVSGRKGHSLGNGYVVQIARKYGAKLIVNSDAHSPGDLISPQSLKRIAMGAGLTEGEYEKLLSDVKKLVLGK